MSGAQEVYDLMDKIQMPTGRKDIVFLKGKKNLPEGNRDYRGKGYVARLDHKQMLLLGQLISEETGTRYTLLPLQRSYDETHKKVKNNRFKKTMKDYWIHNREVILEEGKIISDPMVIEVEGELKYDGKAIKAKVNTDDVFGTLIKAKLFKKPKHKVYRGSVYFENGEASVWSRWVTDEGCFDANADRPLGRNDNGVAAFVKTKEKVETEKVEIAKREYERLQKENKELREKSRKFDELKKEFEALVKRF